jgi:soluble lytic murein transglycosylase-like protein
MGGYEVNPLIAKAKAAAVANGLDPVLVCAVIEQESEWEPFAIRSESESGFAQRYGAEYAEIVKKSANKYDDKWFKFEDIFYASYGLMQTMYPCVIETQPALAARLKFPTQLCDPDIGLEAGCKMLAMKRDKAKGDIEKTLSYWNGGANKNYPSEVLARMVRYQ